VICSGSRRSSVSPRYRRVSDVLLSADLRRVLSLRSFTVPLWPLWARFSLAPSRGQLGATTGEHAAARGREGALRRGRCGGGYARPMSDCSLSTASESLPRSRHVSPRLADTVAPLASGSGVEKNKNKVLSTRDDSKELEQSGASGIVPSPTARTPARTASTSSPSCARPDARALEELA